MTGDGFRSYIGQVLGPTLRRGDIVVKDNVPLHRTQAVRKALEKLGVSVPTFPAYSPDLNPIEQAKHPSVEDGDEGVALGRASVQT